MKSLKIPLESINRRRTDTTTQWPKEKVQRDKTLLRYLRLSYELKDWKVK
jgi:hypothetical protein